MSSLHNVLHCFNTDLWSLLTAHFPPKSGSNIFLATNILTWYSFFHSFFLLFNSSTIYLLISKHLCKADIWMYLFKHGFAIDASYGMASCMYCAISRDLPLKKLRELSSSMKAWCLQSRLPFWNLSCMVTGACWATVLILETCNICLFLALGFPQLYLLVNAREKGHCSSASTLS